MSRRLHFSLPLLLLLLLCLPAEAKNVEAIHIEANRIIYNQKNNSYYASGNCTISNAEYTLHADELYFDKTTYTATLDGHISIADRKGNWIKGSHARLNLMRYKGYIDNATMYVATSGLYLSAKRIVMLSKKRYYIEDAYLTSCKCSNIGTCLREGKSTWSVTSKHTYLVLDNYVFTYPVTFRVKSTPVMFMPFVTRSLARKRKTGFLSPAVGYSSRKGIKYEQPFFINISPSQDITVTPFLYTKTGAGIETEYRFFWSKNIKGIWNITSFNQKHTIDGMYKKIRLYLRAREYFNLGNYGFFKYDINIVNDRNNLRILDRGNLNLSSDRYTKSTATYSLTKGNYWVNITAYYYQDLLSSTNRFTLQKLPEMQFGITNKKLFKNLTLDLTDTAAYNFRIEGDRGYSNDLSYAFSYPFKLGPLSLLPSVGAHQLYAYWKTAPSTNHHSRRSFIPDYSFRIKTSLFRVYKPSESTAIKHTITPSVTYRYIPDRYQDAFPDFVPVYPKTNSISFTLENRLKIREESGGRMHYRELLYLKLTQPYDFAKTYHTPWPAMYEELKFHPFEWLDITSKAHYSTAHGLFLDSDESLRLNLKRFGIQAEYLMSRDPDSLERTDEGVAFTLYMYPTRHLYSYAYVEKSLFGDYYPHKRIGVKYDGSCYSLGIDIYSNQVPVENKSGSYTHQTDTGFWITLVLKGLLKIQKGQ